MTKPGNQQQLLFNQPSTASTISNSSTEEMSGTNCDDQSTFYVCKRNGDREEISFDKITKRLKKLSAGLAVHVHELAQTIISKIYNGIATREIDELAADTCANKMTLHPDYGRLAGRIIISNHHKFTSSSFSETVQQLWENKDVLGKACPLVNKGFYDLVMANKDKINSSLNYDRDYNFDYFGFKTLERAYLLKVGARVVERPQHMFMRVSLAIHRDDIKEAIKSYHEMSEGYFTHATPTLFNMGTQREQAASCFLMVMQDDSIEGIYETLKQSAIISKLAGGIGISIHNIRAKGSYIRGTNGDSRGIVPMLKTFNETACYVDQGGNKRKGSFAIYLEPWHADIEEFLLLRRNTGDEKLRARDLFYALWMPDLFMQRVEADQPWTLMCPDECPGLADVYGAEFKELYERYEREGRGRKQVSAQELWKTIIDSQIETGMPYITYKDAVNSKSNQKNLGTIKSSNLCNEIVEYTSRDEIAVCNLLSVALPKFLERPVFTEPFKVYSKSACRYCDLAKALLGRLGYKYEEINLDDDARRKEFFIDLNSANAEALKAAGKLECDPVSGACMMPAGSRISTVPQIFMGEQRVGGYNDLLEFVKPVFNFKKLREITKMATRNLNKVIDYNYYPLPETERSNRRHRPIGIGIQGLADVFAQLRMPFESAEAVALSAKIAEHMYLSACQASMDLARKRKSILQEYRRAIKKTQAERTPEDEQIVAEYPKKYFIIPEEVDKLPMSLAGAYSSFVGSPAANGQLQFDLWGVEPSTELAGEWSELKKAIKTHGLRNSLMMAMMPTASTSQILGNNECIEPYTNNIYTRQTLAGLFTIINKYLIQDLIDLGIWSPEMKDRIIMAGGSIQELMDIPEHIRALYKTVWEIKQKSVIDHAVARSPYICQTQSMNLFMRDPTQRKINAMHFHAWKSGLKTGIYYLRTQAKVQGAKFSVDLAKFNTAQQPGAMAHANPLNSSVSPSRHQSVVLEQQLGQSSGATQSVQYQSLAPEPEECLNCSA
jgi:ribonucleoside-diphosphate reductase alpha subunit